MNAHLGTGPAPGRSASAYLAAGVPVAVATDDQGVSRSTIAQELERAVRDQKLGNPQLKLLARNSLAYSFLPGARLAAECTGATLDTACAAASPRAAAEWELEQRFRAFELQSGASQPASR